MNIKLTRSSDDVIIQVIFTLALKHVARMNADKFSGFHGFLSHMIILYLLHLLSSIAVRKKIHVILFRTVTSDKFGKSVRIVAS